MRSNPALILLACVGEACTQDSGPKPYQLPRWNPCEEQTDGVVCDEGVAYTCERGDVADERDCKAEKLNCERDVGCRLCKPYAFDCVGNELHRCDASGDRSSLQERCPAALQCSESGCRDLCKDAAESHSYVGCEYWPVFTSNSLLDPIFKPAIAVANPNLVEAQVEVTRGGKVVAKRTIESRGASVVELAFDPELKGVLDPELPRWADSMHSVQVPKLAYRVVSNVPVTVHQFNPLLFHVDKACEGPRGEISDSECDSFTNDASLLLPVHALKSDYIAVARPSFMAEARDSAMQPFWQGTPGFLAVVGVEEGDTVVRIRTRSHTMASEDGTIPALAPGDELTVTLGRGETLQLLSAVPRDCTGERGGFPESAPSTFVTCDPGPDYDLTGTEIKADGAVEVISGHDCANVPFHTPACDHLEEALFPLATWGTKVLVTRPAALDGELHRFRVVSGKDGNVVTFDPPVKGPVTLDRGKFVEIETDQHVAVQGKGPILVAQFLVGQGASKREGDPAMGLAVPVDQYLSRYVFLSPDTYEDKFVNVVALEETQVTLDGEDVDGFEEVGDSGFWVATARLSDAGEHVVESPDGSGVGLIVYGYANFTSYMLPAGLDLRVITPVF